jgi:hypothetical protein
LSKLRPVFRPQATALRARAGSSVQLSQICCGQVEKRVVAQAAGIALAALSAFNDALRKPFSHSFYRATGRKVCSGFFKGPPSVIEGGP